MDAKLKDLIQAEADKKYPISGIERDIFIAGAEFHANLTNWQMIETAPNDLTPVLIFDRGEIVVARRHVAIDWCAVGAKTSLSLKPSHWMPLPGLPTRNVEGSSK